MSQLFNPSCQFGNLSFMTFLTAFNLTFDAGIDAVELTGVETEANLVLFLEGVEFLAS